MGKKKVKVREQSKPPKARKSHARRSTNVKRSKKVDQESYNRSPRRGKREIEQVIEENKGKSFNQLKRLSLKNKRILQRRKLYPPR